MNKPSPQTPQQSTPRGSWKSLIVIVAVVVGGTQAWHWWRDERSAALIQQHVQPTDITMYTTSTCPYCAKARAWFSQHAIPWRECNVDTHATCMAMYEAQGAPGVPLMHVRGRWHLGFEPAWLGQVLATPSAGGQSSPSRDNAPRP